MNKDDARLIAGLLGDDEYEVTLEPRVKHYVVMVALASVFWYWAARFVLWILR